MADTLQNTPLTINLANAGLIAGTTNTVTSTVITTASFKTALQHRWQQ